MHLSNCYGKNVLRSYSESIFCPMCDADSNMWQQYSSCYNVKLPTVCLKCNIDYYIEYQIWHRKHTCTIWEVDWKVHGRGCTPVY